jgi:ARID/BRIGHT DNA binding domain
LQQKSDSLAKLYEMDENPERRAFLDRLLGYMDEIRKPVTACPTISKQPLDLYRLYLYVKERGGFMEVCKKTFLCKNNIFFHLKMISCFNFCSSHRLPKAKLGKILQVYWE